MDDTILVALITAAATLIGVIVNSRASYSHLMSELDKRLSVYEARTNEQIAELTREVREHNNFARRMPVVEEQMQQITRRVTELERRNQA